MTHALNRDRLLYRAFIASLLLHVALVALIPPLSASGGGQSVETLSFVHVVKLRIEHPTPRPRPRIVARAQTFAATPRVVVAVRPKTASQPRARRTSQASPAPPARQAPVVAPVAALGDAATAVRTQSVATATAAPAPPANQNPPTRSDLGGTMPLGVVEPVPVLDPSVRHALLALGVHVTLTVTVDGQGRTTSVSFAPPLAAGVERTIRTMLASASWDPAVCGAGMTCEGSATIRL